MQKLRTGLNIVTKVLAGIFTLGSGLYLSCSNQTSNSSSTYPSDRVNYQTGGRKESKIDYAVLYINMDDDPQDLTPEIACVADLRNVSPAAIPRINPFRRKDLMSKLKEEESETPIIVYMTERTKERPSLSREINGLIHPHRINSAVIAPLNSTLEKYIIQRAGDHLVPGYME